MPRFYFDVREGDKLTSDEEGEEHADVRTARRESILAVLSIGSELLNEENRQLSVEVRDERGRQVQKATLSLTVDDLAPQPARQRRG